MRWQSIISKLVHTELGLGYYTLPEYMPNDKEIFKVESEIIQKLQIKMNPLAK